MEVGSIWGEARRLSVVFTPVKDKEKSDKMLSKRCVVALLSCLAVPGRCNRLPGGRRDAAHFFHPLGLTP